MSHQIFSAFASAVKNLSTGVLKIQSEKSLRLFMFSKGICVDVGSNVKEELPGSFLFKKKVLSEAQYQNYLQKCFAPKTNQWMLANADIQLQPQAIQDHRKILAMSILNDLNLHGITGFQFQSLPNLPVDQAVIPTMDLFLTLSDKFSINDIEIIKPEIKDISTRVSIVKEPDKFTISEDQMGLFTIIQHNSTVAEILDSSFLEKEKILQWILAFEISGFIRIESPLESDKRKFVETLKDDQLKKRQWLKKELQSLSVKNFYEILGIDQGADSEEIRLGFETETKKFSSPEFQKLFIPGEENSANVILGKITQAHAILTSLEKRKEYNDFLSKGSKENFSDQSRVIQEEKLLEELNAIIAARKFDQALTFLEINIQKNPTYLKLYDVLLNLVRELKKFTDETFNQKVFDLLKTGIEKSPHESHLFILLGEWCLLLSQQANALKAFQKALNIKAGSHKLRSYVLQLDPDSGRQIIVEAIYQNLETLNHFEMMGLEPTATEKEIRDTYRDVSKHFHPDRFFNSNNQTIKEISKRVFKEMVASYLVLKDEEKRKEYIDHLFSSQRKKEEKTKGTMPKSPQARRYYDQAVRFMEEKNYSSAKLNIQLAISYESDNYLLQKMLKEINLKLTT
ncbi:MAG: DnaJ domain-containing protein [Bdellovibrionota bacterium]